MSSYFESMLNYLQEFKQNEQVVGYCDYFITMKNKLMNITIPYTHRTAADVYQDDDIENQYEKIYVTTAVVSGNVWVNTMIIGLELSKHAYIAFINYIAVLQQLYVNNGVTVVESTNNDCDSASSDEYEVVNDKKND